MRGNSKAIYLLRHGETDYNSRKMVQGSGIDAPLNDTGRKQARRFFEHFSSVPFDHIFTSPLRRNLQTIAPFTDKKGVSYSILDGLKEISWGKQEGNPFSPESNTLFNELLKGWKLGKLDTRMEGGESPNRVMKRQKEAFKVILNSTYERVLVCTHGRAMRIMLCWLLGYPLTYMDEFEHQNCGYYKLVFSNGKCMLDQYNRLARG